MDLMYIILTLLLLGTTNLASSQSSSSEESVETNSVTLSIPQNIREGDEVTLYCLTDLHGSRLHTVKWFLNGHEFYRYVRVGRPQQIDYSIPGIKLNLIASNGEKVVLSKVSKESAGLYRCEIMTEDSYQTLADEEMLVLQTGPIKADKASASAKSSAEEERSKKPASIPKPMASKVKVKPASKSSSSSSSFSLFYLLEKMFVGFSFCYYVYAIFQFVQKMYEEHEEYEENIVTKRRFSELLDRESRTDHNRRLSMRFPENLGTPEEEDHVSSDNDISHSTKDNRYDNEYKLLLSSSDPTINNSYSMISGSKQRPDANQNIFICTEDSEDHEEDNKVSVLAKTKEHLKDYVDHHHMKSKEDSIVNIADIKPMLDAKNSVSHDSGYSDAKQDAKDIYSHPEIICNKLGDKKKISLSSSPSNVSNMSETPSNISNMSQTPTIGTHYIENKNVTTCHRCHVDLKQLQFLIKDEYAYCISCYEMEYGNKCSECNQIIGVGSKDLRFGERHWHTNCLICIKCNETLADKAFHENKDKTDAASYYCHNCYDLTFYRTPCQGCQQRISSGSSCIKHGGHSWHGKCFSCHQCKANLVRDPFVPRDDKYFCVQCYKDHFAHQCHRCSKAITDGGVKFREDYWHWNCFNCWNCMKSLAGKIFFVPESDPYCHDCYGALFADKCIKCFKPIIGEKGIKMISLECGKWHLECFNCYDCSASLIDKGFIEVSELEDAPKIGGGGGGGGDKKDGDTKIERCPDMNQVKILCVGCATK